MRIRTGSRRALHSSRQCFCGIDKVNKREAGRETHCDGILVGHDDDRLYLDPAGEAGSGPGALGLRSLVADSPGPGYSKPCLSSPRTKS